LFGISKTRIVNSFWNFGYIIPEQMQAIVEVTHKAELKVTAHAPYDEIIAYAFIAVVGGIEHGYGISESTL